MPWNSDAMSAATTRVRHKHTERNIWLFMRISALALLFLALGHLYVVHLLTDTTRISYDFTMARWSHPVWRVYDGLLLTLAVLHGWNGLRVIVSDYAKSRVWRRILLGGVFSSGTAVLLMGLYVLIVTPRGI